MKNKKIIESIADAEIFVDAILNPAELNEALKNAFNEYKTFKKEIIEDREQFIISEKTRLIKEAKFGTGWTADDNSISGKKGGQQVSISPRSVCLSNDEAGFRIFVSHTRSQIKNKEFALAVFEMYLDEYFKGN